MSGPEELAVDLGAERLKMERGVVLCCVIMLVRIGAPNEA